ncbi:MAG: permease-like cell division protein FtsX [Endozoicomonas sp. (ex Botrylloides leachii)]|nr:permease-like cell division protein FtsX [Endozoicomonas sp. (ex Botrylloides leachii)]
MSLFSKKKTKEKKVAKKTSSVHSSQGQDLLKGAEKSVIAVLSWKYIFGLHRQMAKEAWVRLLNTPIASFMNCLMIALAFVLPALFYLFVANIQQLGADWGGSPTVSLYLKKNISHHQLDQLNKKVTDNAAIISAAYISPKEGLNAIEKRLGITDIAVELGFNPLPGVLRLKVKPAISYAELNAFVRQLKKFPEVDQVRLDRQWVERLMAIAQLLEQAAAVLAILLGLTIWLAISNTVSLKIEARKNELSVIKLVGGTDGYIMLPFLYTGVIYGVVGACLAILILWIVLAAMIHPIMSLISLYGSSFELVNPGMAMFSALLLTGMLLGGFGAWVSCYKHLKNDVPS